jgi:c(7)-type cytochrome triheme protein
MRRVERGRFAGLFGLGALAAFIFVVLATGVVALAMPARVRIPRAAQHRPSAPAAQARFSHPAHEPLRCFQCHPGLFPQAQLGFTHADMDRGRFCGGCHDGQRAAAVNKMTCETCHAP